ncbi:unnamed protein product [Caenorhabditis nigoni]
MYSRYPASNNQPILDHDYGFLNEQFFEIDNFEFSWNSARMPQKCSICSKNCSENSKTLKFEGDAIVLLIGQVLRGSFSLKEAENLRRTWRKRKICNLHFSESIDAIFQFLGITKPCGIMACSEEMINILINRMASTTVAQGISLKRFKNCVYKVANDLENSENSPGKISEKVPEPSSSSTSKISYCYLCPNGEKRTEMRNVKTQEARIVLLIGRILLEKLTKKEAISLFNPSESLFSCRFHYSESFEKILNTCEIANPYRVAPWELTKEVMDLVTAIWPGIDENEFSRILKGFLRANKFLKSLLNLDYKQMRIPAKRNHPDSNALENENSGIPKKIPKMSTGNPKKYKCSICSEFKNPEEISGFRLNGQEYLIAVGMVLGDYWTNEQAKNFISSINGKLRISICEIHRFEINGSILQALEIRNIHQLKFCSFSLFDNLMEISRKFCPNLTMSRFFLNFFHFSTGRKIISESRSAYLEYYERLHSGENTEKKLCHLE